MNDPSDLVHDGRSNNGRSPRRTITFIVIAILLLLFVVISFWGMTHSAWWYGSVDQLRDAQWNRIAHLRDRLIQAEGPPAAIQTLDHLLLFPQSTPEDVLHDLIKAAQTLTRSEQNPALRQIHAELRNLITEIQREYGLLTTPRVTPTARPDPTLTPIIGAPVARNAGNSPTNNYNKKGSSCP
jgi:hypothetical protein